MTPIWSTDNKEFDIAVLIIFGDTYCIHFWIYYVTTKTTKSHFYLMDIVWNIVFL